MKRILTAAAVLLALIAVLTGCAARSGPRAAYHTVAYYDGGELIGSETVRDGSCASSPPSAEGQWRDAAGENVDPLTTPVRENVAYTLWHARGLRAASALLMPTEQSRFFPDEPVTRAEAASILCALMEPAKLRGECAFADVDGGERSDAIRAVADAELMEGYPDGTFRPDKPITRAEFIAALCRLTGAHTEESEPLDLPEDYWAAGAMSYAAACGWVDGTALYPEARLTRAEAAVLAVRARGDRLSGEDIELACAGRTPFVDVLPGHWAYAEIVEAAYTNELIDYITGRAEGICPGVVEIGDELCHVSADTLRLERLKKGFCAFDEGLYYAEEDGYFLRRFEKGTYELEGGMYCVPRDGAAFLTDESLGYLYFGPDGRYTSGDEEIDAYVDALLRDILDDETLSKDEKLFEAYCVIRDGDYFYRGRPQTGWERGSTSWAPYCAKIMYGEKYGTCYYWAAAFLYLARRLGYQAYPVAGGVGTKNQLHAWVMIEYDDGQEYIFDVELEWAYRHGFYDVSYSTTNMYKQPLYATHVIYVFPGQSATYYAFYGVGAESDDDVFEIPPEDEEPPEPIELPEDEADEREEPESQPDGEEPEGEEPDGEDTDTEAAGGESNVDIGGGETGAVDTGGDATGGDTIGGGDSGDADVGGDEGTGTDVGAAEEAPADGE